MPSRLTTRIIVSAHIITVVHKNAESLSYQYYFNFKHVFLQYYEYFAGHDAE
jgi:hypothetical protein